MAIIPALLFFLCLSFRLETARVYGQERHYNRYNILFLAVDDLRPELGCYGAEYIRSPNIDKLANSGRRFNRHYVQVPTCGASRYALLTGRCPFESGATGNHAFFQGASALRREQPIDGAQTFPEMFRRSGYHTVQIGKISHQPDGMIYHYDGTGDGRIEIPGAWDELTTPYGAWGYGWSAFFAYAEGRSREDKTGRKPLVEIPDVGDDELPDGMIADKAVEMLKKLGSRNKPFFLAVGFFKPHLPFVAPKKYWDMYENVDIPLPENAGGVSAFGHASTEFFNYQSSFSKNLPLEAADAKDVKRAYAACVSYVDAQIGKILDALDSLDTGRETIVILWGDHGWHLGEHRTWGKHTLLEHSLRSPLIINIPGMKSPGTGTDALVESIDLFPTLIDLCRPMVDDISHALPGRSFRDVLDDPAAPGKPAALACFRGKTLRTSRYRILAGGKHNGAVELYDILSDPGESEDISRRHPEIVAELLERLQRPDQCRSPQSQIP